MTATVQDGPPVRNRRKNRSALRSRAVVCRMSWSGGLALCCGPRTSGDVLVGGRLVHAARDVFGSHRVEECHERQIALNGARMFNRTPK